MTSKQTKAKLPKEDEDHVVEVSLRHVIILFGSIRIRQKGSITVFFCHIRHFRKGNKKAPFSSRKGL
ncbi:MAG: hypothetical protein HOB40_05450 [Candidatus Marinimicrobia bacterium]|jgi:hypothetical protein|nr:hypothetical protein [Candidatus Neomarinimicrobiota bacterium]MBT3501622.1 hypothetical protein [Candidatus Neomarinimicrobiota bacterium]MBT3838348.1 hypothetical protein [Candidatus Neomarinimicrobiota bacterium]MBT3999625.1 hypothetical protein [Candidatus Neomarinimicrobiota bacterium]MBT4281674.1 hypothetical protein [Candidatus Neomarinimicrobiota bacterium]